VLSYESQLNDIVELGVIGLTTALKIQEQGVYQVTIIADVLPNDTKNIKYTSQWAVSVSEHKAFPMHASQFRLCRVHTSCSISGTTKDNIVCIFFDEEGNSLTETSELERDTFDVLWDLSKPESSAEGYFLRITQTIFYRGEGVRPPLEVMPDVSITVFIISAFHPILMTRSSTKNCRRTYSPLASCRGSLATL
jgi:hypothetical protein